MKSSNVIAEVGSKDKERGGGEKGGGEKLI